MKRVVQTMFLGFCFFLTVVDGRPEVETKKFLEYHGKDTLCETEMAHLDSFALRVQNEPNYLAVVIIYGGRRGMARHEIGQRTARIKRYLVKNRGIEPQRIKVTNGGFRETVSVELWLVNVGDSLPIPTPTVSPKVVKYRRTKQSFTCSSFF